MSIQDLHWVYIRALVLICYFCHSTQIYQFPTTWFKRVNYPHKFFIKEIEKCRRNIRKCVFDITD